MATAHLSYLPVLQEEHQEGIATFSIIHFLFTQNGVTEFTAIPFLLK